MICFSLSQQLSSFRRIAFTLPYRKTMFDCELNQLLNPTSIHLIHIIHIYMYIIYAYIGNIISLPEIRVFIRIQRIRKWSNAFIFDLARCYTAMSKIEQQKRPIFEGNFPLKTKYLADGLNVWDGEEILADGSK